MTRNPFLKTRSYKISKSAFSKLPDRPGVYSFLKHKRPVYIGKAVNLKSRIKSYLGIELLPKTKKMVEESDELRVIKVESELESLLLETELIRKYQPVYNIISKDDKHALYIRITKEKYPRVITARKIEVGKRDNIAVFGPFPSSGNVKSVLKMIRKIFPYSDHKLGKKVCLENQIGLCNPCPNYIEAHSNINEKNKMLTEYLNNIRMIKKILSRKSNLVKNALSKRMSKLSKDLKYEEASKIRDQIRKLEYIQQPINSEISFIENPNLLEDIRKDEQINLEKIIEKYYGKKITISRIECFDIAHISGENTTASMVTFISGEPAKEYYRRIKIRKTDGVNDIQSMKEVAQIRNNRLSDWGKPDLIIVDGGKAQVNVFKKYINDMPIIGLAKRTERILIEGKYLDLSKQKSYNLIKRIDDEAHRFARRYHHLLVKKMLFS